ncbi:MAG: hypothetical protein EA363_04070 [Balneolaceae bacterium]|nr:MAG: hypothetical protein EA363_04070 [Balneolaceae bacterium]
MLLWKEGFGKEVRLDRNVDLKYLAATYELSGGTPTIPDRKPLSPQHTSMLYSGRLCRITPQICFQDKKKPVPGNRDRP